jgi:hypothetical protein
MGNIKTKIQIFTNDHSAFGPGKADLLEAISNHGSISAAAAQGQFPTMNPSSVKSFDFKALQKRIFDNNQWERNYKKNNSVSTPSST